MRPEFRSLLYVAAYLALPVFVATQREVKCDDQCWLQLPFNDSIFLWLWGREGIGSDTPGSPPEFTINVTKTIIFVTNAVSETVRNFTSYGSYYTPYSSPGTNSDGTRVETVTYLRFQQTFTTIVTFPRAFIDWPDSYTWVTYNNFTQAGNTTCSLSTGSTTLNSNPQGELSTQFTPDPDRSDYNPQGLGYTLNQGAWDARLLGGFPDDFPDQQFMHQCSGRDGGGGPIFIPYTETSWQTEYSTIMEESPVSSVSIEASAGSSIDIPPSTNVVSGPLPTTTASAGKNKVLYWRIFAVLATSLLLM